MRRFGRRPTLNQLAICIVDFQLGTGQLFAVRYILLGNVHGSAQICICAIHNLPRSLLPLVGEFYVHRGTVQQIPGRSFDLDNAVSAAVLAANASRTCRVNVIFAANRHIHIKPSKAAGIGGAAGSQLCTGVHQLRAICCENIVHRVQFIHSTGQIGQCFAVLLIDANADFADLVIGLFGNRQHTRIFKDKDLCGLMGIRSIFNIDNAV